jgi:hypothetical protein
LTFDRIRNVLRTLCAISGLALAFNAAAIDRPVATEAELRTAILSANDGDVILFTADITLTADLPAIQKSITIRGDTPSTWVLDGDGAFRGFFIGAWAPGTGTPVAISVTIEELAIANTVAAGGFNDSRGGGGAGMGGSLFVASGANVVLTNVELQGFAIGGGNNLLSALGGGGGGGIGGNGANDPQGGGGGLGFGADGGSVGSPNGLAGIASGAASGWRSACSKPWEARRNGRPGGLRIGNTCKNSKII